MADPITGALVKGGTAILGGLLGKGPGPARQSYASVKGAIKAGQEFGLHPLAAIGGTTGYAPTSGSALGDGVARAGEAAGEALSHNKSLEKKQEALLDAQVAEARSRTLLNNVNSRRALLPGSVAESSRPDGSPTNPFPAYVYVRDNGQTFKIPNPDMVSDIGENVSYEGQLAAQRLGKGIRDATEPPEPVTGRRNPQRRGGSYRP